MINFPIENVISILLVDDHAIVRNGLKQILEKGGDMKIVAECASGGDALIWLREHKCDVILLDIAMPGMSGIDLLKQFNQKSSKKIPVLVISSYPEDQYAVRLIKVGASGYLNKECAPEEVVSAVRNVVSGKMHISPAVVQMLTNELNMPEGKLPHETLSNREYEIYMLIISAKTVKEIADATHLSSRTVSTYRTRILEKLCLRNNAELMRYAVEHHLMA
jgi:DNA-binding NarL/FixJ family response regulator